jgi:ribulose-5-phosphate 4-epimerase/fuculose-1-phosphate aldolase
LALCALVDMVAPTLPSADRRKCVEVALDERSLAPEAEIAILARALYREGWDDHNVGHITYRQEDDTLLTLPVERGWDEMRASDIVRMDAEGNLLEGAGTITPPILLHVEFHRAQPGTGVTVHQHPRYTTIWSSAGRVPEPYDQRSAWVANDQIAFYDDYEGGVDDINAVRAAVAAIGDRPCAILRNHGAFVVGSDIAQAFTRSVSLEWRCRQAWHVEAIGGKNVVPEPGQRAIAEFMSSSKSISLMAQLWGWAARREIRSDADVLN